MQLGGFAKMFPRATVEENLDAVRRHNLTCTQYNLSCAGLPTLPESVETAECRRVHDAHAARGLSMAALSGTFNIIDGNELRRGDNMRRFRVLAASAAALGAPLITLCSGTRDPHDMWRASPENATAEAWREMIGAMHELVRVAEEEKVDLGLEPERSNVVESAAKAKRALDEIGSPRLKIVFDAANLIAPGATGDVNETIEAAVELLGPRVAIVHVKPIEDGAGGPATLDMHGRLDYRNLLRRLAAAGFDGPLILHGLDEGQVNDAVSWLRQQADDAACTLTMAAT